MEVDGVEATTITTGADCNNATNKVTTTTITSPTDRHPLDVTMEIATTSLVATTGVVVVMVVALVLSSNLPGIHQAKQCPKAGEKHHCFSLRRFY